VHIIQIQNNTIKNSVLASRMNKIEAINQ